MSSFVIFYPVLCQVSLTIILLCITGRSRVVAVKSGKVRIKDIALGQSAWPAKPTQFVNAYHSQFQLPVLFYVVCGFAQITGQVDKVMISLAWGFAILRCVHAWIHVTSNNVGHRFNAFVAGLALLIAMWGTLAVNLIMAGG